MRFPEWWKSEKPYKIMDCIDGFKSVPDKSIDFILTDPPYGLGGGFVCRSGKGEIFEEEWDDYKEMKKMTPLWLSEAKRVLKDDGSIMVSGTFHSYPFVAYYLKELGFYIINDIIWVKPNPPPTLHHTKLCQSTETIIWARKGKKHYFNYIEARRRPENGSPNKQARNIYECSVNEDIGDRLHPTQKPTQLWEYLLSIATKRGDIVLDPFLGSGTTILVSKIVGRVGLGFEIDEKMGDVIDYRINLSYEAEKDGFLKNRLSLDSLW